MHHDLYDHLKIIIGAIKLNNSSEHYCIYHILDYINSPHCYHFYDI